MPRDDGVPPGTLTLLILRLLDAGPLHGYAIAQRMHLLSQAELSVEERRGGFVVSGAPEADRQRLGQGQLDASETGRDVRAYRLTAAGRRKMETALAEYRRVGRAVDMVLDNA